MESPARQRSYRGLLWGLALVGTLADQVSKYTVFHWLCPTNNGGRGEQDVVPGVFSFLSDYTNHRLATTGLLGWLRTRSSDLMPKVNEGALFGLGNGSGTITLAGWHISFNMLFAIVSVLAAVAIIYWSARRSTARDFPLCASLGLILAGTLGNLYDRVVFGGVRDFLWFHLTNARGEITFNYPVFNVADCCLVCGAILLLVQAYWTRSTNAPEAVTPEAVAKES